MKMQKILFLILTAAQIICLGNDMNLIQIKEQLIELRKLNDWSRRQEPPVLLSRKICDDFNNPRLKDQIKEKYFGLLEKFSQILFDQKILDIDPDWREIKEISLAYKAYSGKSDFHQKNIRYIALLFLAEYDEIIAMINQFEYLSHAGYEVHLLGAIAGLFRSTPETVECLRFAMKENPVKTIKSILWFNRQAQITNVKYYGDLYMLLSQNSGIYSKIPSEERKILLMELVLKEAHINKYDQKATIQALEKIDVYNKLASEPPGYDVIIERISGGKTVTVKENNQSSSRIIIIRTETGAD